jgi:hypothetical protein
MTLLVLLFCLTSVINLVWPWVSFNVILFTNSWSYLRVLCCKPQALNTSFLALFSLQKTERSDVLYTSVSAAIIWRFLLLWYANNVFFFVCNFLRCSVIFLSVLLFMPFVSCFISCTITFRIQRYCYIWTNFSNVRFYHYILNVILLWYALR